MQATTLKLILFLCLTSLTTANPEELRSPAPTTFSSVAVTGNEKVGGNLSVGGDITGQQDAFINSTLQIGQDDCQTGFLVVNGNARISNNINVGKSVTAQSVNTNTLTSNTHDTGSMMSGQTRTGSLTVLKDAQVGGTLFVDEIDPFNGRTTCFNGNVGITSTKKLLVNEINPVKIISCDNTCGIQCVADDTGTTCFSGNVAITDGKKLLVNEINPVDGCDLDDTGTTEFSGYVVFNKQVTFLGGSNGGGGGGISTCLDTDFAIKNGNKLLVNEINPVDDYCIEDDYGFTTFSGNVHFNKDFSIDGLTCFNNNVAIKNGKLLVSEIDPTDDYCNEDDSRTTTFSGHVFIAKDLSFPESIPADGLIKVFDKSNKTHTFIHNFGDGGITDGNTFVGIDAGNLSMTGNQNTAMGYQSLTKNTTGLNNTAIGVSSLKVNTTGFSNTSLGTESLLANTTGNQNTGIGTSSLRTNTTGGNNTGLGLNSLRSNTTGSNNTAIGKSSLDLNSTGFQNTAVGVSTLSTITTGTNNTALGINAGTSYTSSESNNITIGNTGVVGDGQKSAGVIRIGTNGTHTKCFEAGIYGITPGGTIAPVIINSSGQLGTDLSGGTLCFTGTVAIQNGNKLLVNEINPVDDYCDLDDTGTTEFSGYAVFDKNIDLPATSSSAIGVVTVNNTRFIHTFGANNTFVGESAGNFTMTGNKNTAIGYQSLTNNTTGAFNTALGLGSLFANTTGASNSAVGFNSLFVNTTGVSNTALGVNSLFSNATGSNNTASGAGSLIFNVSGDQNTATGRNSLRLNTTGSNNTAVGHEALSVLTTGTNNTALGINAGTSYTSSESNNITIGNTGVVGDGQKSAGIIRIGTNGTHTKCFIAGINGVALTPLNGTPVLVDPTNDQLGTIVSSRRYKKDITDMNEASAQLMSLRPVTFHYNNQSEDAPLEFGLIAEEVAEVFPELVVYNKDKEPETVRYHVLPALLLNEYQQQQKTLDAHEEHFDALTKELISLEEAIDQRVLRNHYEKELQEMRDCYTKQMVELLARLEQLESSYRGDVKK